MDDDNVHILDVVTKLNIPVGRVINGAMNEKLEDVVIIGYTEDGHEFFASSLGDGRDVLWLLERAKKTLLETPDD